MSGRFWPRTKGRTFNMLSNWRRTAGLAVATATLVLAAIGGGTALAADKPTVYIIAPSLTDPFWITEQNGAKQAGTDFGVNVAFEATAQDTGDAGMIPLIQAAIAAKPPRIAIDHTSKTTEAATIAALDAGLPVGPYHNN